MRTFSNSLHGLIHIMTEKERRLFKKRCLSVNIVEQKGYLTVFEMYERQTEHNEQKIIHEYNFKNYSRIKNYLQSRLLDFISELDNGLPVTQLCRMLSTAETLHKRMLYEQCLDILKKAKAVADKHELYNFGLILTEFTSTVNVKLNHPKNHAIDCFEEELGDLLEKIERDIEFNILMDRLRAFKLKQNIMIRDESDLKELEQIVLPVLQKGETYPLSLMSKWKYGVGAGTYFLAIKKNQQAEYYFKQNVSLLANLATNNQELEQTSVSSLIHLMYFYAYSGRPDRLPELLSTLMSRELKFKSNEISKTEACLMYESYWLRHTNATNRAEGLKKNRALFCATQEVLKPDFKLHIITNISVNYFMLDDFKKALEWINKMDESTSNHTLKNMTNVIKLYRLVLYYELKQLDYLEYAISNLFRYLITNSLYFKFEKVLISGLKKLIAAGNTAEERAAFLSLAEALLELKKTEYEENVFKLFNFYGWVMCKLNKEGFEYIEKY